MGKRVLIFITVLLITGLVAGWYFFVKESRYIGTSPLKAVPVEAPFFIRIRDLADFTGKVAKNSGWKAIRGFREVDDLYKNFTFLDSIILQNSEIEKYLHRKELIFVPGDSSKLFLLQIGSISEKNGINLFVRDYFQSKRISATTEMFNNASLQKYEWEVGGVKKQFFSTFHKGMLIFSDRDLRIREAISQLNQPSVLDDANYLRVNKNATENVDLNIYINHKTFPEYLSRFHTDSVPTGIFMTNYARWTEVDVVQKENQLLVSGYTVPDTALANYLEVFRHQKPIAGTLTRFMPAITSFFAVQNLSDPRQYFSDFDDYRRGKGVPDTSATQRDSISKDLNLNFRQYLIENWTGEAATVFTNYNLAETSDNRYFLMKMKSGNVDPMVAALKKRFTSNRKIRRNDIESGDAAKNNIWKMPLEEFSNLVGEFYCGPIKTRWVTAVDGFLLFGATPGSIKRYLNLLQSHELLSENATYAKFSEGLALTSNFHLWCNPDQSLPFFEYFVRPTLFQNMKKAVSSLRKIENIAWQWSYENGLVYNTGSLHINPAADPNQVPFWRYPLKVKMRNRPVFFSYSSKTQRKELIFQDMDNNLIDLDKEGVERWRIRLEGPVLGTFKMIDYHKDGEYQMLFNTKDAIHLIDQNGTEIRNFPVRLKSKATNEISVFDYDGKKDYRLMLACQDRKVYNFDREGKIIAGWQSKQTEGIVEQPIKYFRIGSRDYIVYFDHHHTYITDRQGKERVRAKDEFVHSKNQMSLINSQGASSYFVTTDETGKIRLIGTDGASKKVATGNFSASHTFMPVELNGDGSIGFLFLDKQSLSLYDFSGKVIYSKTLKETPDQMLQILPFGKEKLIELYSVAENKTILVRKDGSVFDLLLPAGYSLQTIGSFDENSGVFDILALSPEGFMSNFQMIMK